MPEPCERLAAAKEPASITAAAGCGKTEEIAKAIKIAEGRQLVLTHTNAGVAALRSRLRRYQVPESQYRVDTIASWLLKYAGAYPEMSGLSHVRPTGEEWKEVYSAAQELIDRRFFTRVFRATYSGVFVDEYQDCTMAQHRIILKLAELVPVRVLGDPLQGIFDFQDDPLVDWEQDVCQTFKPVAELGTPYRWTNGNQALGEWLCELRQNLQTGEPVDLSQVPAVTWVPWSDENESRACAEALQAQKGSIVGIHQWPNDAHATAKRLAGKYQSMEEMDCRDLIRFSGRVDQASGRGLAIQAINLTVDCASANSSEFFKEVLDLIRGKRTEDLPNISNPDLGMAFYRLIHEGDLAAVAEIVTIVMQTASMGVYRGELLTEVKRAAKEYATGNHASFSDAAYEARRQTRIRGRRPEKHVISRTLLIKGQEFDHGIILNADQLPTKKSFYVSATRGAQSLTILSKEPVVHYQET